MIDEKRFQGVQKDILFADKKNQLVSAGAGSGKTTVMIEKIADLLIEKNVQIENLLVVTFTVLAAQEMKERLIKKLKSEIEKSENEKEELLNLIEKVKTSSIDTIDGFSSKTIKKYFYELEISPNIEILSDATKDFYLTKAMNKTFNEYFKDAEKVYVMLDLFGGNSRNLENLKSLVLTSYYNIINIENYEDFLDKVILEYKDNIQSENIINEYMCRTANNIVKDIIEESVCFDDKIKARLSDFVNQLENFNSAMSFKTNLNTLFKLETLKFTPTEYKANEGLKALNSKISDLFDLKNNLEKNQINENFDENNQKIIKYLHIFIELLKIFIKNYNLIKEKNNLIDFNDLNRLMLKLLKNEKIKTELQEKYKYIFIDEYQDVNPLQDSLMSSLVGENSTLFMVGDVKQSIYGFRGSSPEWFLSKYNKMKSCGSNEDVFDMNINFRSSPKILNFINEIFVQLMTKEIADIDYKNDALIEPKRDDIVDEKVQILLVEEDANEKEFAQGVYSVKADKVKQDSIENKEAKLVAKIITELVGSEFYDANTKENRKLKYKDFAILTHSDKDEQSCELVEILHSCNIPLNRNNKLDILESEVIKLILSILKCVTETGDDVDYLATMLSLTEMDIDEVVQIRNKEFSFYENLVASKERVNVNKGFEILEDLKQASYYKTNKELIYYILDYYKLRYFILRKPNGEKELNLLEEFLEKVSATEEALGLCEFVEMVESNVDTTSDFASQDKEDSVTLQTIHKSKGLEYPVVILFNSSKVFAYLRENDAINFNANIGFGIDYFDFENRVKMDSLTKFAIRLANNKKGYKEELRLLYVALTRAKNKLFITGTYKPNDKEDLKKTSYTNMILSCFKNQFNGELLEKENFVLKVVYDVDDIQVGNKDDFKNLEILGVDFEYEHKNKFNVPFKNSVTGINSKNAEQTNYKLNAVINNQTQYNIEEKAQIGVEYHSALELLDLQNDYKQNSNYENVDYKKIELAYNKLRYLAKDAVSIKKEAEFMMFVPYSEVVESDINDKILIQGVVDLLIEKENSIIIVDYKFSSLPIKVLKEKYAEQLKLYKLAVEKAFNKPVENTYIYSINSGELF